MLKKLLKYDLKYMIKNMMVFYVLALFFSIVTRLIGSFDKTVILGIIKDICFGIAVAMLFNILINTFIRSFVRFRDSLYKDESYLTHTLPVSKDDLYNSKFIQVLLFFIVSFIIIIGCLFILFYSKTNWDIFKNYLDGIASGLDTNASMLISCFLLITFLELFNTLQCGFMGIILGYRKNNGKLGFSFLFGIIIYLLSQSLVLLLVYVAGLFNTGIMDMFRSASVTDISSLKVLTVLSTVFYIVLITCMNFVCRKLLNKGVNIE